MNRAAHDSTGPDAALADQADGAALRKRKFVRVIERHANGLVGFEFAIGWPELSVELLLPPAAFDEFCAANQVIRLEPRAADPTPGDHRKETDE